MSEGFSDDLRQSYVVMKNEFVKHLRGKKIIMVGLLLILVWGLITALPILFNQSMEADEHFALYMRFVYVLAVMVAALLASSSISSEYEERTALVLFTRPIKKWPIFMGKLFSSLVLGIVAIGFYYLLAVITVFAQTQTIPPNILLSLAFAVIYIFAATGVAMMFSSLVKRSSTSAILTLFFLLLITMIIFNTLSGFNVEAWYMIDYVSNHISSAIENSMSIIEFGQISVPTPLGDMKISVPGYDPLKATGVAAAWGIVTLTISYMLMKRREL